MKKRLFPILSLLIFSLFVIYFEATVSDRLFDYNLQDAESFTMDQGYLFACFGEGEEIKVGNPIPAPIEWRGQDFAGRNTVETLSFNPESLFASFTSAENGWIVVSYSRGVAASDTYIFKTRDAGETWTEVTAPDMKWYPAAIEAIDSQKLIIISEEFNHSAPVYVTEDSGRTWNMIASKV